MCSPDAAPLHIDMPDIEYGMALQVTPTPKPSTNWEDTINETSANGTANTCGLMEISPENQVREVLQRMLMPIYDFARMVWSTRATLVAAAFIVALYCYARQRLQEILEFILDCAALVALTLLTTLARMCAWRVGFAQHIPRPVIPSPFYLLCALG